MNKNKKITKIKKSWELPNEWHFQQRLRGGRIHVDKTKIIPRKAKNSKNQDWGY